MKKLLLGFSVIILLLSCAFLPFLVKADIFLTEDFENWNVNDWGIQGDVYPESADAKYKGNYGMKVNVSEYAAAFLYYWEFSGISGNPDVFRINFKVCLQSLNAMQLSIHDMAVIYDDSAVDLCGFVIQKVVDGETTFWWEIVTQATYNLTMQIVFGAWYEVEIVYERAVEGYCYAWITQIGQKRQLCLSEERDTTQDGEPTDFYFGKVAYGTTTNLDIRFDNIYFSDTPGRYPADEIPNGNDNGKVPWIEWLTPELAFLFGGLCVFILSTVMWIMLKGGGSKKR